MKRKREKQGMGSREGESKTTSAVLSRVVGGCYATTAGQSGPAALEKQNGGWKRRGQPDAVMITGDQTRGKDEMCCRGKDQAPSKEAP